MLDRIVGAGHPHPQLGSDQQHDETSDASENTGAGGGSPGSTGREFCERTERGPGAALKQCRSQSPLPQKCADESENAEADEEYPDDEHPHRRPLGRHCIIS